MKDSVTILVLFFCVLLAGINLTYANEIGCLDTTFKLLSPNDTVCVSAFEDSKVQGVTCHISQAKKGGWGSVWGRLLSGETLRRRLVGKFTLIVYVMVNLIGMLLL